MRANETGPFQLDGQIYTVGELQLLAEDSNADPALLLSLALRREWWPQNHIIAICFGDERLGVFERLASNPSVPIHGLIQLAREHILRIMKNPTFRLHALADLSVIDRLECGEKRRAVERGGEECAFLMRYLARDKNALLAYRVGAANNPCCPEDLLRVFVRRHQAPVRSAAVSNPRLPADLQEPLAVDRVESIRFLLAYRTDLLPKTVQTLLDTGGPRVREALDENPTISLAG